MSDEWLEADLLDDAIENLEMLLFMLGSTYDPRAKWKWIVIATYQALYGFALCSIRGTNDFTIVEPKKRFVDYWAEYDRLVERTQSIVSDDKDLDQLKYDLVAFLNKLRNENAEVFLDDLYRKMESANRAQLNSVLYDLDRCLTDAHLEYVRHGKLIDIREALRRAQPAELFWRRSDDKRGTWRKEYNVSDVPQDPGIERRDHDYWRRLTHSRPLITTPEQDRAIDRLVNEFRNGFVHRRPGYWAIMVEALAECVRNILPVIRFIALESDNILYYREEQRSRTEDVLDLTEKRLAIMSESTRESAARQIEEQGVDYVTQQSEDGGEVMTAGELLDSLLREAGWLVERPDVGDLRPPISRERREELAQRLSGGKPLSQVIIEDRER